MDEVNSDYISELLSCDASVSTASQNLPSICWERVIAELSFEGSLASSIRRSTYSRRSFLVSERNGSGITPALSQVVRIFVTSSSSNSLRASYRPAAI